MRPAAAAQTGRSAPAAHHGLRRRVELPGRGARAAGHRSLATQPSPATTPRGGTGSSGPGRARGRRRPRRPPRSTADATGPQITAHRSLRQAGAAQLARHARSPTASRRGRRTARRIRVRPRVARSSAAGASEPVERVPCPTSTAAASLEPPPSPACIGMRLGSRSGPAARARSAASRSSTACQARLAGPAGAPGADERPLLGARERPPHPQGRRGRPSGWRPGG